MPGKKRKALKDAGDHSVRDFCYTQFNYTDESIAALQALECTYHVFGKEICPTTGNPHLQGYIYFKHAKTVSAARKLIGAVVHAHVEACKGSSMQNREYCTKGQDFFESGVRPMSQKEKGEAGKVFWDTIKAQAKEGKLDEIDPKIFVTQYNALKRIATDHAISPAKLPMCTGHWIWGDHGCGKTTLAREMSPDCYVKQRNGWWDGYQGQKTVVIDDVDKNASEYLGGLMKDWGDRVPFRAQTKGGTLFIRPEVVIVTSQYHPSDIWEDCKTVDAILDRFQITHITGKSRRSSAESRPRLFPEHIDNDSPEDVLWVLSKILSHQSETIPPDDRQALQEGCLSEAESIWICRNKSPGYDEEEDGICVDEEEALREYEAEEARSFRA